VVRPSWPSTQREADDGLASSGLEGLRRYAHIGTGNYNADTAQIYEDVGLFTADPEMTADVSDVFNLLTGHSLSTSSALCSSRPTGCARACSS
jgi:polyphosphate kinase